MAEASVHRTTRHHRVDEEFLSLLEEDFGIAQFALRRAFLRMPPAPKKQAIEVCEWAAGKSANPDERGRMVRGWARRRKVGQHHPSITGAPAPTFAGREAEGV